MKFGLKQKTIDQINAVFEQHPQIEKVIIYGSRAKGNYRTGSDIDLTVFSNTTDLNFLHKIENELDDLLLPYMIDLSIYSQIQNQDLKDHIDRIGQIFYP